MREFVSRSSSYVCLKCVSGIKLDRPHLELFGALPTFPLHHSTASLRSSTCSSLALVERLTRAYDANYGRRSFRHDNDASNEAESNRRDPFLQRIVRKNQKMTAPSGCPNRARRGHMSTIIHWDALLVPLAGDSGRVPRSSRSMQ